MKSLFYHGTCDVRDLAQAGGFQSRTERVECILNVDAFREINSRYPADMDARTHPEAYFRRLDELLGVRQQVAVRKPVYFASSDRVAKTYADKPAFDFQNAIPALLKCEVRKGQRSVIVNAAGQDFRGISLVRVTTALQREGIDTDLLSRFLEANPAHVFDGEGGARISTRALELIASILEIDTIDVINVVDTYDGKGSKCHVRMAFDVGDITILNLPRLSMTSVPGNP